jgi:hypothetical protein
MMLKMQPATREEREASALQAVDEAQQLVTALREQVDDDGRVVFAPRKHDADTCFRREVLNQGRLTDGEEDVNALTVNHVHLQGVSFRSGKPFQPGTVKFLRTDDTGHTLHSKIRIVSCRLRADGAFDIKAEFF